MKNRILKVTLIVIIILSGPTWDRVINASLRAGATPTLIEKLATSVSDSTWCMPSVNLLETAISGMEILKKNNLLARTDIITIIDFTLSANRQRLWVLDLANARILFHTLVSHGRNSGDENATSFSNKPGSSASSPGFYVTRDPYDGRNGLSLAIDGIEKGINDNALKRGVVIHGAEYVSFNFIHTNGRLGRSQGCPAVPVELNQNIIEAIKGGSCLFIYTDNRDYIANSQIIKQIALQSKNSV